MLSTRDDWELPEPFPKTADDVLEAFEEREAEVLERFEDGAFAVKFRRAGRRYEPLDGSVYYVPANAGERDPEVDAWDDWWVVKGGYRHNERERRAIILGRLVERTDFWTQPDGPGNCVPLNVALDGQKAIAAYLFAWDQQSVEDIADRMDRAESTVRQYLSDYKAGRTG